MSAREKNVLTFTQHADAQCEGVDVSQSINRLPKLGRLHGRLYIPTYTTHTKMYVFALARVLNGVEALSCQGFPVSDHEQLLKKTSPKCLHDLAGNAMSANVVLAVFLSMMVCLPWKRREVKDGECEDVSEDDAEVLNGILQSFSASAAAPQSDSE